MVDTAEIRSKPRILVDRKLFDGEAAIFTNVVPPDKRVVERPIDHRMREFL
jgi:hypothetical protein